MIGGDKEVVSTSLPTNQHSFEAAVYALTFHLVGNFVCLAIIILFQDNEDIDDDDSFNQNMYQLYKLLSWII